MLQTYLITWAGLFLAQLAPGPNLLAVTGAALGQGRRAALFTALGVATSVFAWVTILTFGFAGLLVLYPQLLTAMEIVGGLYLLYVGAKSIAGALRGGDFLVDARAAALSAAAAWRRGFLVNMTNPKSALVWSAITSFLYSSGLSVAGVLGFAVVGFVSSLAVYGGYGVLFSSGLARRAYARFAPVFQGLFGLAFCSLGAVLLWDGVSDILAAA